MIAFDWHLAARIIRAYKPFVAYAAVARGPKSLIWKDGGPTSRDHRLEFVDAGTYELWIGDEVWNCFVEVDAEPDYWPASALTIAIEYPTAKTV